MLAVVMVGSVPGAPDLELDWAVELVAAVLAVAVLVAAVLVAQD